MTEDEVFAITTDLLELSTTSESESALNLYTKSKLIATDAMMRSEFSSELVGRFMRSISVKARAGQDVRFSELQVERKAKIAIESLKHLNYLLTIMSPRLKVVEFRGYDVVKTIFETLNSDEGHLLLPDDIQVMYERLNSTDAKKRMLCDFVAGMTDRYAVEFYGRLRESGASIFKPI